MPLDLQQGATNSTAPANVTQPFVIKEDVAANPLTITLDDTDLPHGRARELTAFQSGGKVDVAQGGIYNPGSDRVILQMMAVRENDLVIKGAFRDRIRAGAQRQPGGAEPNHARKMRDLIEQVKRRRNPLKISWNGDERGGVLIEAVYDEEGPHDIAYTLTFLIATPPTGSSTPAENSSTTPTPSIEDLRSQMAANHAAQVAAMNALVVNAAVVAAISNAMGFVTNALNALGVATTTMERVYLTTPQRVLENVNAVKAAACAVQAQGNNLKAAAATAFSTTSGSSTATAGGGLDSTRADAAMQTMSADAYASWWVWQATTELEIDQMIDAMRQISLQSNQLVRDSTRLYRVQVGDTLEAIALTQLGSKARASDLGITQDQLVPGRYVRVAKTTLGPRG